MRQRRLLCAWLSLAVPGCGQMEQQPPPAGAAPGVVVLDVNCPAFAVVGDPAAPAGARWSYSSTDSGTRFVVEGVLFAPAGTGPFPAVLLSHGAGGLPSSYSAALARTMVGFGLVAIATRYTHAADPDGRNASLSPAGPDGASEANVSRARKTRDLLSCLGSVDMSRVAAHGHSMGAFVTAELLGTFPDAFRAGSHTAGGTSSGPNATRPATAQRIRTPYQMHHGEGDAVVNIQQDENLDAILAVNAVPREFHRYPGLSHEQMAFHPPMLQRVREWYVRHGVLR